MHILFEKMNILVTATIVLAALLAPGTCLTDSQKEELNEAFGKVHTLLDKLNTDNFVVPGLLDSLGTLLPGWVKPIGKIISLLGKKGGGGDKVNEILVMIQQQLVQINAKLDRVSRKIEDLTRLADWSRVTVPLIQYENNIMAVRNRYDEFIRNAHTSVKEIHLRIFLNSYELTMQESPIKLFNAFVKNSWLFEQNVGAAAQRMSKNDRAGLRKFLVGLLGLIMRGVEMELSYKQHRLGEAEKDVAMSTWERYMTEYADKMREADNRVRDAFASQQVDDVKELAEQSGGLSQRDFATKVYDALSKKYYWRDWIVVVNPTPDFKFSGCPNHFAELHGVGGRYIAFGSVDNSQSRFTKAFGDAALAKVNSAAPIRPHGILWEPQVKAATGGCGIAKMWGAVALTVKNNQIAEVIAKESRLSTRTFLKVLFLFRFHVLLVVFG